MTEMKEWNAAADGMNEVRNALLQVNLELIAKMQLSLDIRLTHVEREKGKRIKLVLSMELSSVIKLEGCVSFSPSFEPRNAHADNIYSFSDFPSSKSTGFAS